MALIADGFRDRAQQQPDQTAIVLAARAQDSESCTYAELHQQVRAIAAFIAALPRSRAQPWVGLLLQNRLEFLTMFLGTAIAGGVAVVYDPRWPTLQIEQVISSWPPDIVIAEQPKILHAIGATVYTHVIETSETTSEPPPSLPSRSVTSGLVGGNKAAQSLPTLGDLGGAKGSNEASLNWHVHSRITGVKAIAVDSLPLQIASLMEPVAITDSDPFYIGFTSGTTRRPKGVVRHHRSWVKSFAASQVEFRITASDRVLIPGPLTHSLTLYATLEALNAGATAYLLKQFDSRTAIAQLQQHSITRLVLVPLMLSAILKTAETKGLRFPDVQMVVSGGAKLDAALRDRIPQVFPNAEIVEYYGALELSFVSVRSSREAAPADSIGRPFYGVEVSVRRDDGAGAAATGEIGWIGVRSELVCHGYLEQDGSGLRVVEGWATVGDRGWQDADGYLHLIGREEDMIVAGGVNVYPSEVEAVLHQWPEIEEAAVLGLPDGDRGEVVAAVICWSGCALPRTELLQRLRLSLPDYKCPRHLFTTREFPRTPSGKIVRPDLRRWVAMRQHVEPMS